MATKKERPTYAQRVMVPAIKRAATGAMDYMNNGPKPKPRGPMSGGPIKPLKSRLKR